MTETLTFKNKVVVITGGANGIGKTTKEAFEAEGAVVEVIDIAIRSFDDDGESICF